MIMKKPETDVPNSTTAPRRKSAATAAVARGATASRILHAADELFCTRGFEGVSVGDIAERAGVNKALVFYHYQSKERLFERVVSDYYEAHRAALAHAFEAPGDVRQRFHQMVTAYVDFIAANRRYAALVQQAVADPDAHDSIRRHLVPLYEWTVKALAEVAPEAGPLAARHLFLTFSGATINYFTYGPVLGADAGMDPSSPESLDERRAHLHWLVDTLLDGLFAAKAPRG